MAYWSGVDSEEEATFPLGIVDCVPDRATAMRNSRNVYNSGHSFKGQTGLSMIDS